MEVDGPPRMVGWITWSGRERSSQTQFLPVPGVWLIHPPNTESNIGIVLIRRPSSAQKACLNQGKRMSRDKLGLIAFGLALLGFIVFVKTGSLLLFAIGIICVALLIFSKNKFIQ
jgi:hypothetical protein